MRLPRPRRAQLGTGALVVAALALGQALDEHLPDGRDGGRLFETPAAVGDTVRTRAGEVTIRSVDGARAVAPDLDPPFVSPGLVVVVAFDYLARDEESTLTYGELRDGEGRVTTVGPFGQRSVVDCPRGPVGLVVHCVALVETDPSSLPGARLGLAPDALDPRFDEMVVVDLGVTTDDVRTWSRRADPLQVAATGVAGRP